MTVVLRTCLICGWARLGIGRELAVSMRNELRSDRRKNNQEPNFSRQEWRFVPIHLPAHLDSFVSSFSGTICGYKMDSGRVTNYKNRIRAPGFIVDSTLNRCGDAIFSIPLLRHSVELALNTIQRWCCSKFGQNRSCTSYTEWYEINSSYCAFEFACLHVHSHQVPSVSLWIVFCCFWCFVMPGPCRRPGQQVTLPSCWQRHPKRVSSKYGAKTEGNGCMDIRKSDARKGPRPGYKHGLKHEWSMALCERCVQNRVSSRSTKLCKECFMIKCTGSSKKAAHWQGTCDHPEMVDIAKLWRFPIEDALEYIIIGGVSVDCLENYSSEMDIYEVPTHICFYFELANTTVALRQLKEWFPSFDFEPRYMSPIEAADYCRESSDFIERGVCPLLRVTDSLQASP